MSQSPSQDSRVPCAAVSQVVGPGSRVANLFVRSLSCFLRGSVGPALGLDSYMVILIYGGQFV